MATKLSVAYPTQVTIDGNNPDGTFKNDVVPGDGSGTPFERTWAKDIWGAFTHVLKKAGIIPDGSEENETDSQYYDALEIVMAANRRGVEFETSKDLVCDRISATQARASFSRMSLLDSSYVPKYLDNKILTWTMPGDLEAGQSPELSTTYGCWLDSDEVLRLVADIESVTDGTTAGFLDDSANTFATRLVKAGATIYNLDDKLKTTVKTDATVDGDPLELNDDIFTSSPKNYKIVKQSPEGLGENRERLFNVFRNSAGDFDDSHYEQPQETKFYTEAAGEISIPAWTTVRAISRISQINDWTGSGAWFNDLNAEGGFPLASNITIAITGTVSKNIAGYNQSVTISEMQNAISRLEAWVVPNSPNIILYSENNITGFAFKADYELDKKPPYHH